MKIPNSLAVRKVGGYPEMGKQVAENLHHIANCWKDFCMNNVIFAGKISAYEMLGAKQKFSLLFPKVS